MNTNLMNASAQWSSRPDDERFWTLDELYSATRGYAEQTSSKRIKLSACRMIAGSETGKSELSKELLIQGPNGGYATFSNFSFSQLCGITSSPASWLRNKSPHLIAPLMNEDLKHVDGEQIGLFHQESERTVRQMRCVTSDEYARIWDWEVVKGLGFPLRDLGLSTPPAMPSGQSKRTRLATPEDCMETSIVRPGMQIGPAGLYASDHDCFLFLVDRTKTIDLGKEKLARGVFIENSEVGVRKLKVTCFLFDYVCFNHIVWGAQKVAQVEIKHIGRARERFQEMIGYVNRLMGQSTGEDLQQIKSAQQTLIATSKDDVINMVFEKGVFSRKVAEESYALAKRYESIHGNPNSVWGMVSGATRYSQTLRYADDRNKLDLAAAKLFNMKF